MLRALKMVTPLLLVAATGPGENPRFNASGEIVFPADYREWVFLSSGLNMNYSAGGGESGDEFDNVFVDPASWRGFKQTGHWPEGTVFAKEGRHGETKGSISQSGQWQDGDATYLELHVRDTRRFASGWGFFEVAGTSPARVLPEVASCYACHQHNGAVDTTFVQFYPTARAVAVGAGTFDPAK